jgi:Tfp pilus assembly protein PilF
MGHLAHRISTLPLPHPAPLVAPLFADAPLANSIPGCMLLYAEFLWRVRKDREGADDMYRAACETAPKFADAHEVRGQFLLEAGDTKGAVEAMRVAVSLAPPDGGAGAILWYNLGHVLQLMAGDGAPGKNFWNRLSSHSSMRLK